MQSSCEGLKWFSGGKILIVLGGYFGPVWEFVCTSFGEFVRPMFREFVGTLFA